MSKDILLEKLGVSFRLLEKADYDRGLFDTLNQLTKSPKPERKAFDQYFDMMHASRNRYINIVGVCDGKIVAFGTCLVTTTLEGRLGKIENIVVCESQRGKGLGRDIILLLKDQATKSGATKLGLYCADKNVEFYSKLGFKVVGTEMHYYADLK